MTKANWYRILAIAAVWVGFGLLGQSASAAVSDACTATGNVPGTITSVGPPEVCTATVSPAVGASCGTGGFYNGNLCVTNGTSCWTGSAAGTFTSGTCNATTETPIEPPTAPAAPIGFTSISGSGTPPSQQQPLCVNASPFVGAGIGYVAGVVLCYTGSGQNSEIYAYSNSEGGWTGISVNDLWARDDVTVSGVLSGFGGAQIFSPERNDGLQVTNNQVLARTQSTVESITSTSSSELTPGSSQISVTNGTSTSSQTISAGSIVTSSTNGANSLTQTLNPTSATTVITNGSSTTQQVMTAGGLTTTSTSGSNVLTQTLNPTSATTSVTDGTSTSTVLINASGLTLSATAGSTPATITLNPTQAQTTVANATFTVAPNSVITQVGGASGSTIASTPTSVVTNVGGDAGSTITTNGTSVSVLTDQMNVTARRRATLSGGTDGTDLRFGSVSLGGSGSTDTGATLAGTTRAGSGAAVRIDGLTSGTSTGNAVVLSGRVTTTDGRPAVLISGVSPGSNSSSLDSRTGVKITGDGNFSGTGTVNGQGVANWGDVVLASKNYEIGAAQGIGAAVIVNDYGVTITAPPLKVDGNRNSTNNFGSGAGNQVGTTLNNQIGQGGQGTVNNTLGSSSSTGLTNNSLGNNSGRGVMTNVIGRNSSSGATSNSLGENTGSGPVSNALGSSNGSGTVTNQLGTGTGVSLNSIGNANASTTVGLRAGSSQTNMRNGVNQNVVAADPTNGLGNSVLANATLGTSGATGILLKGTSASHVRVDSQGRFAITAASETVEQSQASMTIVNGIGNVHGFYVDETQASISGGTQSSSMILNDNGATFSQSSTGRPIQLHGVADGTSDYDAANFRQLGQGLAMAGALAAMPAIESGKRFGLSAGFGSYAAYRSLALGAQARVTNNLTGRLGIAYTEGQASKALVNVGVGYSW